MEKIEYTGKLTDMFIKMCAEMFGKTFIVHVVHMLHHLPEDVKMFGILQGFSAFPFEDFNFQLTRNMKSSNKPLQQMLRCYNEMIDAAMFKRKNFENYSHEMCSPTCIKVDNLLFQSDRPGDQYCSIQRKTSCQIIRIDSFMKADDGTILITGKPFQKLGSLLKYLCNSKYQFLSPVQFSASEVTGKFYPVPHYQENNKITMVKILHH